MANKIYSLGNINLDINEFNDRIVIQTKHGQKFEILVGKDNLSVTTITSPGTGIIVMPEANNKVIIEENEE